ncbi:TfoX/Sxy family DNA transformation protein [Enterococcus pallens]|nr:TfoX/Sxy family DNA transformation protein [Enterococcus pallens]
MKQCIACGMPMERPEDHAQGDINKSYCLYCAAPDGRMQTYEEKRKDLIEFVIRTQGIDEGAAVGVVETMMKDLPAWREGATMTDLQHLPNVGKVLAEHLNAIGIKSYEDLINMGTESVFLKIRIQRDAGACLNMLYGIEGAIQGIPKKQLAAERKKQLVDFYQNLEH